MVGGMVSSSDLADLTRSAQAVEERSKELASKQAENLEQVSEELLCSPEIIRWLPASLPAPDCVCGGGGGGVAACMHARMWHFQTCCVLMAIALLVNSACGGMFVHDRNTKWANPHKHIA